MIQRKTTLLAKKHDLFAIIPAINEDVSIYLKEKIGKR